MFIAALALTLGASVQMEAAPAMHVEPAGDLAAAPILARRTEEAIAILEQSRLSKPEDPAVLINLGIAYAHIGREAEARALFAQALAARGSLDLAISSGDVADSRLLARRAIRMLDRGEFRSQPQSASQLTLRD